MSKVNVSLAGLCAFLICSCSTLHFSDYPADLNDWLSLEPPDCEAELPEDKDTVEMTYTDPGVACYAANYSEHEWKVYCENGIVKVRPFDPDYRVIGLEPVFLSSLSEYKAAIKYTYKTDNGWLISFNAGEFGGELWWFSPDGKRNYKILDDNINGFVETRYGLLALSGLFHMSNTGGELLILNKDSKTQKWTASKFMPLHEVPHLADVDKNGSIIIITSYSLVRVASDAEPKILLRDMWWGDLYPNSVTIDANGVIYIGMRQGIAKISFTEKESKVEWFVPNKKILEQDLEAFRRFPE